ncbi:MAG: DUF1778 domain-containing protein [Patulibacter sp.]|nr:DUF1778 domain-containing protein [Patulibacter sp.]
MPAGARSPEIALGYRDRTRFVLDDEQWGAFCAALDRPAEVVPAARDLFARPRPA